MLCSVNSLANSLRSVTVLLLVAPIAAQPAPSTGGRPSRTIPVVQLNLDLPPEQRWTSIVAPRKADYVAVSDYFRSVMPAWAVPLIEELAGNVKRYFGDFGLEMEGIASALGVKTGEVVIENLMMQLESLGLNCSNWNDTGPTTPGDPGCMAVDPKQTWCYCHEAAARGALAADGLLWPPPRDGPGLCTSIVAQDPAGRIVHARNMDWNLPEPVRRLLFDVDYVRNGTVIGRGTGGVGFVGAFNGMVSRDVGRGRGGFSISIDARGKGGSLGANVLQALRHRSSTPSLLLRRAIETCTGYSCAVGALSQGEMIDECYFIVGGAQPSEGAVISRGRKQADDVWTLDTANASDPSGWFRLQTNYDHWQPPPRADDRRTPGNAMMNALGQRGAALPRLRDLLMTPPVFNPHTDFTGLFSAATGTFNSSIWLDAPRRWRRGGRSLALQAGTGSSGRGQQRGVREIDPQLA